MNQSIEPSRLLENGDPPLLIVISAPSGAGKSTVCQQLLDENDGIEFSISTTTRDPRSHEEKGADYYFVDDDEFDRMIRNGEFLEWANVHGERYGTPREPVMEQLKQGRDVLLDLDVQGARQVKQLYPDAVLIFLAPPSMEELERRLRNRNTETEAEIQRRLANARTEMNSVDIYDYLVINEALDRSQREVECILRAEKCRLKRIRERSLH